MKKLIKESVSRFLGWKLPADFAPDAGITFKPNANTDSPIELQYKHEPTGTNLFHAGQAEAMLVHVAAPLIDRITELEAQLTDAKRSNQILFQSMQDQELRLEAAKKANQWQPIETAPKDETLLGFVPHSMGGYLCPIAHSKSGGWFNASCVDFSRVKPSHWMPASYPSIDTAIAEGKV